VRVPLEPRQPFLFLPFLRKISLLLPLCPRRSSSFHDIYCRAPHFFITFFRSLIPPVSWESLAGLLLPSFMDVSFLFPPEDHPPPSLLMRLRTCPPAPSRIARHCYTPGPPRFVSFEIRAVNSPLCTSPRADLPPQTLPLSSFANPEGLVLTIGALCTFPLVFL